MQDKAQQHSKARILVECAMLIALSTVLSMFKIIDFPYGGSVTMASMLPVVLLSYRHGLGWGLGSGLVYAAAQQLLGLSSLSYMATPQGVIMVVLFDYILAFMFVGLGGLFRRVIRRQSYALMAGGLLACLARYACHVISGATVWRDISIPADAAVAFSFIYNATFMIPEAIILVICLWYLGEIMDFRRSLPTRMRRQDADIARYPYRAAAGLCGVGGVVYDVIAFFGHLQNPDTGKFDFSGLANVHWLSVGIVTGCAVLAAVILLLLGERASRAEEK